MGNCASQPKVWGVCRYGQSWLVGVDGGWLYQPICPPITSPIHGNVPGLQGFYLAPISCFLSTPLKIRSLNNTGAQSTGSPR